MQPANPGEFESPPARHFTLSVDQIGVTSAHAFLA